MWPWSGAWKDEGRERSEYMTESVKEKIIALIEEILNVPGGTITEDTRMEDVEEWDSLAHVMIIGELQEKLGISIPLDEAVELSGAGDLLVCAEKYLPAVS